MKWKTLNNFSRYLVSEEGNVFDTKTKRYKSLLTVTKNGNDYFLYRLMNDQGQDKAIYISSIIRKTFNNQLPEFPNVEHKPLKDYEDRYEVYSDGKIWSKFKHSFLLLNDNQNGYLQFFVYGIGKRKPKLIHRIVYETFAGPIYEGYQINHKDQNKSNNDISNLEQMLKADHLRMHKTKKFKKNK